jgi:hypothetical protein
MAGLADVTGIAPVVGGDDTLIFTTWFGATVNGPFANG